MLRLVGLHVKKLCLAGQSIRCEVVGCHDVVGVHVQVVGHEHDYHAFLGIVLGCGSCTRIMDACDAVVVGLQAPVVDRSLLV